MDDLSFEKAFQRLEELLKRLNSTELPLEEALLSYEEAEKMIAFCQRSLNNAEERIEKLVKNRQGSITGAEPFLSQG